MTRSCKFLVEPNARSPRSVRCASVIFPTFFALIRGCYGKWKIATLHERKPSRCIFLRARGRSSSPHFPRVVFAQQTARRVRWFLRRSDAASSRFAISRLEYAFCSMRFAAGLPLRLATDISTEDRAAAASLLVSPRLPAPSQF